MALTEVPYSRQFRLDCCTSALVDAVHQVMGVAAANVVANKAEGGKFYSSLRPLGNLLHEAKVGVQIERVSPALITAIQSADPEAAFDWFISSGRGSVFIVQFRSPGGGLHAVTVNTATGVIVDGAQEVHLWVSVASLWVCAGGGGTSVRVLSARRVVRC